MVARYESGAASPTVRTLGRLLRAAGHELRISGPPTTSPGPVAATLRARAAEIHAAAAAIGAANVRVFGSVARGEETSDSDIDLLVDFPAATHGLFPLLRLAAEIESIVGRPVDVAAVDVMAEPVRASALAEAIPL
jgi:predicted nucleotidyltransferase